MKRQLSELDIYAVEAKRHGLHYGAYVSAVEHGTLPPPEVKRVMKATGRTKVCCRCGADFEIITNSRAQLCPVCRDGAKASSHKGFEKQKGREYINCAKCGKEFKRPRNINGGLITRKLCDECRKVRKK